MKRIGQFLLLLLLALILNACQSSRGYYLGAQAQPETVAPLTLNADGPQLWQDLYVRVKYQLKLDRDQLQVVGSLEFTNSTLAISTRIADLRLRLFLLNDAAQVVQYTDVTRVLDPNPEGITSFALTVPRPPDAVALSFGYEGLFIDNDPESSGSTQVWNLPQRQP